MSKEHQIQIEQIATPARIIRVKNCVKIIQGYSHFSQGQDGFRALQEISKFMSDLSGTMSEYGYCPHCTAPSISRERRINGNDTCENGHVYPSRASRNS